MLPLPHLRELRQRRAMTQEELGKAAGVGSITILRIELEKQRARLSTIRKLARALGVTPEDLMGPPEEGKEAA